MLVTRTAGVIGIFAAATLMSSTAEATPLADRGIEAATAATAPASMKFTPTVKTVTVGSKVTLTLTVNTGGQPVNAVQAFLAFPDAKLDCTSFTLGNTFTVQAAKLCNGSSAAIAASIPIGAANFNGTTVIARVTFKTRRTGKALVSLDRNRTMVVDGGTGTDILGTWNTSTVTIQP